VQPLISRSDLLRLGLHESRRLSRAEIVRGLTDWRGDADRAAKRRTGPVGDLLAGFNLVRECGPCLRSH
jgi:hypothetical protein